MKKYKLNTAVIGVGNMGKNHARVLHEISRLTAVCDATPKTARIIAAEYDVPYYTSILEMLQKEKLDAVTIAVPTAHHFEAAKTVLKAGIPLLLEKPITSDIESAQKLKALALKQGVFFMVGHVERFNPVVRHAKRLIEAGKFGDIISLLAIRVGVIPPTAKGSDVAIDLAIHDIDVFNYLLGQYPESSKTLRQQLFKHNTSDAASILIQYPTTQGVIQVNWVTPIKIRKLYLTGTKLFAELDYINQQIIMLEKVTPRPSNTFFELVSFSDTPLREIYVSKKEPLTEELRYFLKNCRAKPDPVLIESAIEALKVVSFEGGI